VDVLRGAFKSVRLTHPFTLDAMVVLPDHLHCIWTLPQGDTDFSTRWRLIKTWFTKHLPSTLQTANTRGERAVWQHRYWEHMLRDETDFERHVEYIHYNPVKHGLATAAIDWPYSSFQRYVKAGLYPSDWGRGGITLDGIGRE
jgi:putative transposase